LARFYHVYILRSIDRNMVKVGKANNLFRVKALAGMRYGGASDWQQIVSFPLQSDHAALALEAMINARLSDQGHKIPRFSWVNYLNKRPSFADECFQCDLTHALAVAQEMAAVFDSHVAVEVR
jgi:hypothetical protein